MRQVIGNWLMDCFLKEPGLSIKYKMKALMVREE